ncbi:hypothetical protein [Streptomyces atriruber]|uniref:hypothetical protein n=1 Tax=Streptomyces atriruber TaxID=545121 RepID=UPI0006E413A8|nr:hypothetical protein [Streptomyces atriruber]
MKSRDPGEGACPRCRKSVPLVKDSQGDLVLELHHLVLSDQGYVVSTCRGSRGAPARELDDSEDWGWKQERAARTQPYRNGGLPGLAAAVVSLEDSVRTVIPAMQHMREALAEAEAACAAAEGTDARCTARYGAPDGVTHRCRTEGSHRMHTCAMRGCPWRWRSS